MKRGFTLLETLIAATLFLLVLGACFELSAIGMQSYTRGAGHMDAVRGASQMVHWFGLEVGHARRIYAPDLPVGTFVNLDTDTLVCRIEGIGQGPDQVLGYHLDPTKHRLSRKVYQSTYNPLVPSSLVEVDSKERAMPVLIQQVRVKMLNPADYHGQHLLECEVVANDVDGRPTVKVGSRFRLRY